MSGGGADVRNTVRLYVKRLCDTHDELRNYNGLSERQRARWGQLIVRVHACLAPPESNTIAQTEGDYPQMAFQVACEQPLCELGPFDPVDHHKWGDAGIPELHAGAEGGAGAGAASRRGSPPGPLTATGSTPYAVSPQPPRARLPSPVDASQLRWVTEHWDPGTLATRPAMADVILEEGTLVQLLHTVRGTCWVRTRRRACCLPTCPYVESMECADHSFVVCIVPEKLLTDQSPALNNLLEWNEFARGVGDDNDDGAGVGAGCGSGSGSGSGSGFPQHNA